MSRRWWVALAFGCASQRPNEGGELCVTGAKLLDREGLFTIVADDRIRDVTDRASCARTIDAGGAYVLPGFHDAHIHMMSGGEALGSANLEGAKTIEEIVARVKSHAASHPDHRWVIGRGWSYDVVPAGTFPHRSMLDGIDPRPIVLESYDGHATWVSSAALAAAEVTAAVLDPNDGKIVRDEAGPTGVLLEGATALVEEHAPKPSRSERVERLATAIDHCLRLGVTSINDFAADPEVFDLYEELERSGRLPIRVTVSLPLDGDLERYAALRSRTSEMIDVGYLKGFVDGVVESKTAFMLEPYVGAPERGRPLIAPEDLARLVRSANEAGFRVALHAIGDAAVRLALDTYEKSAHHGNRIEHIEVAHPEDLRRFHSLGVIASMQPFHANPFGPTPEKGAWSENLGALRWPHTFPWRGLIDAKAELIFGSDWPVMTADPLEGLAVAVTRRDRDGQPERGWIADQKVTIAEAVASYAKTTIAVGEPADLVVLSKSVDLEKPSTFWGPSDRIRAVIVGGQVRLEP